MMRLKRMLYMILSAKAVANIFKHTETIIVNIAAVSVISTKDSEVRLMNSTEFKREKLYQTTMIMAKKLLSDGIISKADYTQIDTIFTEMYRPSLGTLFADISLTLGA